MSKSHILVSFSVLLQLTLVLSLEMAFSCKTHYVSNKAPTYSVLLRIPIYLCDQNTGREQTAESWLAASQASPSSAVCEESLHQLIQDTAALN